MPAGGRPAGAGGGSWSTSPSCGRPVATMAARQVREDRATWTRSLGFRAT